MSKDVAVVGTGIAPDPDRLKQREINYKFAVAKMRDYRTYSRPHLFRWFSMVRSM